MKIVVSFVLALAGWTLCASDQITVFNSHALMKFEKTSLQVRRFDFPTLEKLDDERTLRVCEALDNSKFVYFGSKFDIEHRIALFRALFESAPVVRSLSDFLARRGMIFFSPLTWTQLNSWPKEFVNFFATRGVSVPNGGNCVNTSDNPKREYQVFGQVTQMFKGSLFDGPRKCEPLGAIRHFGELPGCWKTVYASKKEGWPLMVAADCAGGGRVVFSHVFSVDRVALSPFYLNLLEGLYGSEAVRMKSSHAAYLEDAKRRGLTGLHVREVPPFTRLFPDSKLPEEIGDDLKEVSFTLARNDREIVQFALYNCTDENLMLRLEPEIANPMHDFFAFYDVLPWMATNDQTYNEIVAEMNGANILAVPAGETKVFLLAAKTDRQPGTYSWSFSLVPVNYSEMRPRTIKVKAEVLDLRLEEKDLPDVYTFGPYNPPFAEISKMDCCLYLGENHVNVMQLGEGPNKAVTKGADGKPVLSDRSADYLSIELDLQKRGFKWVFGYQVLKSFLGRLKAVGLDDIWSNPETQATFREWARRWSSALRDAGVDFNRFWLSIEDEPRTPRIPQLVEAAKILKAEGFRLSVTIATWGVQEDLDALKGSIDLWFPWEDRFRYRPETAESELAFYKATGKPFLPYLCSITSAFAPYLDYFRFRGIRAFLFGADGIAMWAANSWRGNEYYAPDDTKKYSAFLFHHGKKPVGTMRFEAFREGIEDLYWLRRAAASGKSNVLKFTKREGLEKLMVEDAPAVVRQWRNRLLHELSR